MRTRLGRSSSLLLSAATALTFALPRSCTPAPPEPAPAPVQVSADIQRVVDLTNAERSARGRGALTIDGRLVDAAQRHSNDMAAMNTLTHTGSDGSNPGQRMRDAGYPTSYWAENAAAGYSSADDVMNGWMNSSGHRANILSSRVVHIGVAVAYAADGTPYWTMTLASGG